MHPKTLNNVFSKTEFCSVGKLLANCFHQISKTMQWTRILGFSETLVKISTEMLTDSDVNLETCSECFVTLIGIPKSN